MVTFTCPGCRAVSHNPHDVAESYCGRCHQSWHVLGPGVWYNVPGCEIHADVEEVARSLGMAYTQETAELIEAEVVRVCAVDGIPVFEVLDDEPPRLIQ